MHLPLDDNTTVTNAKLTTTRLSPQRKVNPQKSAKKNTCHANLRLDGNIVLGKYCLLSCVSKWNRMKTHIRVGEILWCTIVFDFPYGENITHITSFRPERICHIHHVDNRCTRRNQFQARSTRECNRSSILIRIRCMILHGRHHSSVKKSPSRKLRTWPHGAHQIFHPAEELLFLHLCYHPLLLQSAQP